jgi:hypothetical protein
MRAPVSITGNKEANHGIFNDKYHPGLLWLYGHHRRLVARPWDLY